VTQLDPVVLHLSRQHKIIPAEPLKRIAEDVGMGMTRANRLALWSGVVCFVCLIIALAILLTKLHNGRISTGRFVGSLLPYCGIWVAPLAFWMGARGVRFQRIRKVMLQHLRCPHCGYDMQGLPSDPDDNVTLCPECGCVWELDSSLSEEASTPADNIADDVDRDGSPQANGNG